MSLKLGFLASNNGSAMRAIIAAIESGALKAEARLVVSNKQSSPALAFACAHDIPTLWIPTQKDEEGADIALAEALLAAGAELIILSGYLRKLGPKTLAAFPDRILNVHPALLPRHGGAGFYGRRVHEAVAAAGERESGATIHLVDEIYDHGRIIAQRRVPLDPSDDAAAIERKVTALEPALFVETLQAIAAGSIVLQKP